VLEEECPAIVLVYLQRACLVVPVITNIPDAPGLVSTSGVAGPPTAEVGMLIHFCNTVPAIYVEGANIVIFHLANEGTVVVVADPECSSGTTII
jgi:hypothetical protein